MMRTLFLAAVLSSAAAGQDVDVVRRHMDYVTTSFPATPKQQGLMAMALAEARIAAQHAALAATMTDSLDAMKRHAAHVIHAVDPSVESTGPGLNYGVKRAAGEVAEHIRMAANGRGASRNLITHAAPVAAAAGNVAVWSNEVVDLAQQVRASGSASEAARLVAELNRHARQLIVGVDADGDGRTTAAGEGGMADAEMHLGLLLNGEGM